MAININSEIGRGSGRCPCRQHDVPVSCCAVTVGWRTRIIGTAGRDDAAATSHENITITYTRYALSQSHGNLCHRSDVLNTSD